MASAAVKKPMSNNNNNQAGPSSSSKVKVETKPILKKKTETLTKGKGQSSVDTKNNIKTTPSSSSSKTVKSQDKGKTTTPSTSGVRKREKKVYSLPGQKYDVPEEREPLRMFYESLSKQIPTSEMAEFWLMEHGMLSPEKSKKAYEKKQRKQKQQRMGTPIKSPPPSKPQSSNRPKPAVKTDVKAKKRTAEDSDDEFIGSPKRRKG